MAEVARLGEGAGRVLAGEVPAAERPERLGEELPGDDAPVRHVIGDQRTVAVGPIEGDRPLVGFPCRREPPLHQPDRPDQRVAGQDDARVLPPLRALHELARGLAGVGVLGAVEAVHPEPVQHREDPVVVAQLAAERQGAPERLPDLGPGVAADHREGGPERAPEAELAPGALARGRHIRQHVQPAPQVTDRLDVGRAGGGEQSGLEPPRGGGPGQPGLGEVVGHGLRPVRRARLPALLEGAGDGGVERPPAVAQEGAVRRVPDQRVLEQVAGFRRPRRAGRPVPRRRAGRAPPPGRPGPGPPRRPAARGRTPGRSWRRPAPPPWPSDRAGRAAPSARRGASPGSPRPRAGSRRGPRPRRPRARPWSAPRGRAAPRPRARRSRPPARRAAGRRPRPAARAPRPPARPRRLSARAVT